jgi:hypothetical protein
MSVANLLKPNNSDLYARSLKLLNTSNSTSISSGSLIIDGGMGVNGDIYAKGIILTNTTASVSTSTGVLIVNGGAGINGDIYAKGVVLTNTTASVSTSTGALIVNGGAGFGGNINIGGTVTASNIYNATVAASFTGPCTLAGNLLFSRNGNSITCKFPMSSSTSTVGTVFTCAAIVPAGMRISEQAYIPIVVTDNSAQSFGSLWLYADGTMTIKVLVATNFTGSGNAGFGFNVSWMV